MVQWEPSKEFKGCRLEWKVKDKNTNTMVSYFWIMPRKLYGCVCEVNKSQARLKIYLRKQRYCPNTGTTKELKLVQRKWYLKHGKIDFKTRHTHIKNIFKYIYTTQGWSLENLMDFMGKRNCKMIVLTAENIWQVLGLRRVYYESEANSMTREDVPWPKQSYCYIQALFI